MPSADQVPVNKNAFDAGKRNSNDLSLTVSQVTAALREAQSRSLTQTQGATWGVHFSNTTTTAPFTTLFFIV